MPGEIKEGCFEGATNPFLFREFRFLCSHNFIVSLKSPMSINLHYFAFIILTGKGLYGLFLDVGILRAYRIWRFRRKIKKFVEFFMVIDRAITKHTPRWKRQQFWRDFWKSEQFRIIIRKTLPKLLLKDLK